MDNTEDRYEAIELIVKVPVGGESWSDRLFEFITADCQGDPESEENTCTCGMESMGGMTGTLDDCFAWHTSVGQNLQPIDLARAIVSLTERTFNTLGSHEEQLAAEGVIKAIEWARKEIEFEDFVWGTEDEEEDVV